MDKNSNPSLSTLPQSPSSVCPPLRRKVSFVNTQTLFQVTAHNSIPNSTIGRSPTVKHPPKSILKMQLAARTNIPGTYTNTKRDSIFKEHFSPDISDKMEYFGREHRADSGIEIGTLPKLKTENLSAIRLPISCEDIVVDENVEGKAKSNIIIQKPMGIPDWVGSRIEACFPGRRKSNAGEVVLKRRYAEDRKRRRDISQQHKNMIAKHLAQEKRRNAESAMRMRVDREEQRESSARLKKAVKENRRMDGPYGLYAKLKKEAAKLRQKIVN